MKLEERFKSELDKRKFNIFEIAGFREQPNLALIAGMAIGYQLACKDALDNFIEIKEDEQKNR